MKFFKNLVLTVIAVAAVLFVISFSTKTKTDEFSQVINQLNPMLKTESVYVKIDNSDSYDESHGNYIYSLTGYSASGRKQPVVFTGMGKLKDQHFLKLTTKGSYVSTYAEVLPKQIPHAAYERVDKL